MIHVHSYEGICQILAERFPNYPNKRLNIVGLIIAPGHGTEARKQLRPVIGYWHHRSDNVTDFFCAGYSERHPDLPSDAVRVKEIKIGQWWYSDELLVRFIHDLEERTTWKPEGGLEVIFCAARFHPMRGTVTLDFSSAVVISLNKAIKAGAAEDLSRLLERLFRFAKSINERAKDPVADASDSMLGPILKQGLKDLVLSMAGKRIHKLAKEAEIFAVRDISRRAAV